MREAPSTKVINSLLREGCKISVYDSKAVDNAKKMRVRAHAEKADEALRSALACVIVTE